MHGEPVWLARSDPDPERLPVLSGTVDADVCVVGLGGAGLAAIGAALELGATVVGIDGASIGAGAAGRNAGFFLAGLADFHHVAVAALGRRRATRAYQLTLAEMDRIAAVDAALAGHGSAGALPHSPARGRLIERSGSLRIADGPAELRDCEEQLAAMRSDDLPVEPYTGPEGTGLLFPLDGAYDPLAWCRRLAGAARAAGARLFEGSPALEVGRAGVRTPAGEVVCDQVVVAVDGFLERLLPELSGRVRTTRIQALATEPVGRLRLARPVYTRWGYDFWRQLPDGRLLVGGQRDRAIDREWDAEAVPSPSIQAGLDELLATKVGVRAVVTHRWAGCAAYTTDRLPVCDEVRPGVWATGGYCGTGNVIGAMCGRAVVELALTGTSALTL